MTNTPIWVFLGHGCRNAEEIRIPTGSPPATTRSPTSIRLSNQPIDGQRLQEEAKNEGVERPRFSCPQLEGYLTRIKRSPGRKHKFDAFLDFLTTICDFKTAKFVLHGQFVLKNRQI